MPPRIRRARPRATEELSEVPIASPESFEDEEPKEKPQEEEDLLEEPSRQGEEEHEQPSGGTPFVDDYESSLSDEDADGPRARVGDVPRSWYDEKPHVGYDVDGNPVLKQNISNLQKLMKRIDDPNFYRTVMDYWNQEEHVLTDRELEIINNICEGRFPEPEFNPYQEDGPWVEWKQNPFYKDPTKRSFLPNTWEHKEVWKLVRQIRKAEEEGKLAWGRSSKQKSQRVYGIWDENTDIDPAVRKRMKWQMPLPKPSLPKNSESYNAPPEYYSASHHKCLRHVPFYPDTIRDRYRRCLDLFYSTRRFIKRKQIDPNTILPDLPSPDDLRPYPCRLGFEYKGHTKAVRGVSCSPDGQWIVTGCDDGFARVFEVNTGRIMFHYRCHGPVINVQWNPNPMFCQFAAVSGNTLYIIVPIPCCASETTQFDLPKEEEVEAPPEELDPETANLVAWREPTPAEKASGLLLKCTHHANVGMAAFHDKGDYIATVLPKDFKKRSIWVHVISKKSSINPFKKMKDPPQAVAFGHSEPYFFIQTKRTIRMFHLTKQQLVRKYKAPVNQMCGLAVHASDDHVLCGSIDKAMCWFDYDWGEKAWKKMATHSSAIRCVAYHPKPNVYPLFATGGDDGEIHVFHGRVYDDFTKDTLIVPLKVIKGHQPVFHVGIFAMAFHPSQPWVFTCGSDKSVRLWTE